MKEKPGMHGNYGNVIPAYIAVINGSVGKGDNQRRLFGFGAPRRSSEEAPDLPFSLALLSILTQTEAEGSSFSLERVDLT